jgi:hypothetical protein
MTRSLTLSSVLVISLGCGGMPPSDVRSATSGVVETRGDDGTLRRHSTGAEGYAADLAHFRQRLRDQRASRNADPKLTDMLAEVVSRLEQAPVRPADAQGLQNCGVSYYDLSATVSPGFAYGSASAAADLTEFGPPSPWTKDVYTTAYATSSANTQSDPKGYVFYPPGWYSQSSSASTGPAFCQVLYSIAYIRANGCDGGYDGASDEIDTCQN